jgi:hypothetical protein
MLCMRKPNTYGKMSKEDSKQSQVKNIADNQLLPKKMKPNKVPRKKWQNGKIHLYTVKHLVSL